LRSAVSSESYCCWWTKELLTLAHRTLLTRSAALVVGPQTWQALLSGSRCLLRNKSRNSSGPLILQNPLIRIVYVASNHRPAGPAFAHDR
jgi:hypothetical protein